MLLASAIQLAEDAADHEQSRLVEIDSDPDPPLSEKDDGALVIWNWHFVELGAETLEDVCVDVHAAPHIASAMMMAEHACRQRMAGRASPMHAGGRIAESGQSLTR